MNSYLTPIGGDVGISFAYYSPSNPQDVFMIGSANDVLLLKSQNILSVQRITLFRLFSKASRPWTRFINKTTTTRIKKIRHVGQATSFLNCGGCH